MKTKVSGKKPSVIVKDLKSSKNPKGGLSFNFGKIEMDYKKAGPGGVSIKSGYLK